MYIDCENHIDIIAILQLYSVIHTEYLHTKVDAVKLDQGKLSSKYNEYILQ